MYIYKYSIPTMSSVYNSLSNINSFKYNTLKKDSFSKGDSGEKTMSSKVPVNTRNRRSPVTEVVAPVSFEESRKDDSKEKTLSTKATLPFRGSSEHNILNNTSDYDSYNDQLGVEIDDFDKDFVVVFNENLRKGG